MAFNDPEATVKDWANEYNLTTPVIVDDSAMGKFGQGAYPSVSLFGPGHVLIYQGRNWEPELEAAMNGE